MSWLRGWLTGGANEIGWDDLVDRIAAVIARGRQFGKKGEPVFPAELQVTVVAPAEALDVVRGFLEEPDLDRRVQAELANRCDCEPSALPLCAYAAAEGPRLEVQVEPRQGVAVWELEVAGGDRSGTRIEVPDKREIRFGRGEWHGGDRHARNDLIVSTADAFVSRRAGRLLRTGHSFEVEALDQGDFLTVHRGDNSVRPARSASGRVALRSGDEIELASGDGDAVRLIFRRRSG